MKCMVVYQSKWRKMISFSTTKVDNVNVLCFDPEQRSWRFMRQKVANQRKIAKHPTNRAGFYR